MRYLFQERFSGEARSGLEVQGDGEMEEEKENPIDSRTQTCYAVKASGNHPASLLAHSPPLPVPTVPHSANGTTSTRATLRKCAPSECFSKSGVSDIEGAVVASPIA